ncbi:hypothetical protein MTR67_044250 [Solanum verrucosum]|uniref:Uncharacterized protein n=1 Tax=Solanum verrucosum TaxID=315347 RepID=A0AAF0URW8_SOLVR|nr:hypothetical protein MTR67_044250 [Solanum verrucosum]
MQILRSCRCNPRTVGQTMACAGGPWFNTATPPQPSSEKSAKSRLTDRPTVHGLCPWIKTSFTQPLTQTTVDQHRPSFDPRSEDAAPSGLPVASVVESRARPYLLYRVKRFLVVGGEENPPENKYSIFKGAKSLSGSSYYIPSLLSISTVDAIEALNAISGGEDIPAATIGVDGTSSVRVRALAGITSASYLTVAPVTYFKGWCVRYMIG